jgi:hypothetical protein
MRPLLLGAALGLLAAAPASSQTYTGSYAAPNDRGGQTVVMLRQVGDTVVGTLAGNGSTFQLKGVLEDGTVVGAVTGMPGGGLWFEAELDGRDLHLTLVGAGADGQPDYAQMSTLVFMRQGGDGAAAGDGNSLAGGAQVPGAQPQVPATGGEGLDDGTPLGREWSQYLAGKKEAPRPSGAGTPAARGNGGSSRRASSPGSNCASPTARSSSIGSTTRTTRRW